jgi:hypothetical protein
MRNIPCTADSGQRLGDVVAGVLGGKMIASQIDLHRDSTGRFSATVHLILPGGKKSQLQFHAKQGGGVFWQSTRSINNLGLQQIQYILSRHDLPEGIAFAGVKTMDASEVEH